MIIVCKMELSNIIVTQLGERGGVDLKGIPGTEGESAKIN